MAQRDPFIDEIIWQSPSKAVGDHQWRAIVYTLPRRYGRGIRQFGFQYRRASVFGSAPEQWTDAKSHPNYARYLPNNGLPKQLSDLIERYRGQIDPLMGRIPQEPGTQLPLNLVA